MAQERSVIDLSKKNTSVDEDKRKEFRARAAKVVTRGLVVDRLNVDLPPDVHGEWIRDDAVAIAEARALGFELDTTYAVKSALHTDAAGKAKVGDAIFMTMAKWQKEEIDLLKKEQYDTNHGMKGGKSAEQTHAESGISPSTPIMSNENKTANVSLNSVLQ